MHSSPTLDLLKQLISCPSITPEDASCQSLISERLEKLGFTCEPMRFENVHNLWARKGQAAPVFVFAGHTDVVPPGPLDAWTSPPFEPTIRDGYLYGRGAADMKGGLAAMIIACERFLSEHPNPKGSIAFLITGDEEGPADHGTKRVIETLQARHEKLTWCVIGEPSSTQVPGDVIRIGRRGSLTGYLTLKGKQGHIAFPHLADNPIHKALATLSTLCQTQWDIEPNLAFPPTSFQIANIHSDAGASNVIPGELKLTFNFRYSTAVTAEELKRRVELVLMQHGLQYDLNWRLGGLPFLTENGALVTAAKEAIQSINGHEPELSTGGGTSDGRFIAPTGCEVIELGPVNATVHKVDECTRVEDLDKLVEMYLGIMKKLLT